MKRTIITALLALVAMVGQGQETTGRVIDEQSQSMAFDRQVMLADSITKNPVSYATVYDTNGTVIGRSDMGGYINLQKGFEYHISHIGYEPKSLVYNDDSIIFLSPSSYKLSEVSVTARKKKYYHC